MNIVEELNYMKEISDNVMNNIRNSDYQKQYRRFYSEFRNIPEDVLEQNGCFYIMDSIDPFNEIFKGMYEMELYNLVWGNELRCRGRFMFPLRDSEGTIIGFVGNDIDVNAKYKYMIYNPSFLPKQFYLFNYENIKECYKSDEVIVCEGPNDSLSITATGNTNNLGILTSRMSRFQSKIISRCEKKIFVLDNDEAGEIGVELASRFMGGKKAFINILKGRKVERSIWENETIVKVTKEIKDIDDVLQTEQGKKDFSRLLKRIREDMKSPFYTEKNYSL